MSTINEVTPDSMENDVVENVYTEEELINKIPQVLQNIGKQTTGHWSQSIDVKNIDEGDILNILQYLQNEDIVGHKGSTTHASFSGPIRCGFDVLNAYDKVHNTSFAIDACISFLKLYKKTYITLNHGRNKDKKELLETMHFIWDIDFVDKNSSIQKFLDTLNTIPDIDALIVGDSYMTALKLMNDINPNDSEIPSIQCMTNIIDRYIIEYESRTNVPDLKIYELEESCRSVGDIAKHACSYSEKIGDTDAFKKYNDILELTEKYNALLTEYVNRHNISGKPISPINTVSFLNGTTIDHMVNTVKLSLPKLGSKSS